MRSVDERDTPLGNRKRNIYIWTQIERDKGNKTFKTMPLERESERERYIDREIERERDRERER